MTSLFSPAPDAYTAFLEKKRTRIISDLSRDFQTVLIEERKTKAERKREDQRERAMR